MSFERLWKIGKHAKWTRSCQLHFLCRRMLPNRNERVVKINCVFLEFKQRSQINWRTMPKRENLSATAFSFNGWKLSWLDGWGINRYDFFIHPIINILLVLNMKFSAKLRFDFGSSRQIASYFLITFRRFFFDLMLWNEK